MSRSKPGRFRLSWIPASAGMTLSELPMLNIKLQNLPPFGKLFVGMTAVLMLCVCLWSMIIFYVDQGIMTEDSKPLYMQDKTEKVQESYDEQDGESQLRHNVGLAHTHINGQTLLYFVLGFLFLFTSTKDKIKKYVYWIFGVAVFTHTVGLSGQGFYSIFDDLLALSGVTLLVVIPYMCLLIIVDLFKLPEGSLTNE